MGLLDWFGRTVRTEPRGWDHLPAAPPETRIAPPADAYVGRSIATDDPLFGTVFYPAMLISGAGDPALNSAVAACLAVVATAIAEPPLRVYRETGGERIAVDDSELGRLLARPNPAMDLDTLLSYISDGLHRYGNAYWRKIRSGDPLGGNVVELWPISPLRIEVYTRPGSTDYITEYHYTPSSGRRETLSVENVVHFRYGLRDDDHRLGSAPLDRLRDEVSADNRATRYADRLLANLAINGLALEFDRESPSIDQPTADALKARIRAAYGGDNVGAAAVLSPGAKLTALGFSPEQMAMDTLHRVPEERISAVIGVPAITAGLGAGLERATYANVREAREMLTEQKCLPLWALIESTITRSLVPDFEPAASSIVVAFDTSDVRALAQDADALATRLVSLTGADILDDNEARAELGYAPRATPATLPTTAPASEPAERRLRAVRPDAKAIEDIPDLYRELRERVEPTWIATITEYLADQSVRVVGRLRGGADSDVELVPDADADVLVESLTPLQRSVLDAVAGIVRAELDVSFRVDDPATRAYLDRAGHNIVGINETTRAAVARALAEGQALGEGIEYLARRLRGLPAFGSARGRVVARTELGTSQNEAALTSYRASDVVVGVRVLDGDYDAACQAMNGRTFALDDAPAPLEHPNCTRALVPLVDAGDVADSA